MKTVLHQAATRGRAAHGWLQTRHTFSFADYYDPKRMGFGALRVLNNDVIAPSGVFGTHPHRDMEIVTIPLAGALRHADSMGHRQVITAGEVQAMTAGTGITHSEHNDSDQHEVSLLQIWIMPREKGLTPRYDQAVFPEVERRDRWQLLVSPDGADGSLIINQDARFFRANLSPGSELSFAAASANHGLYLFVIAGEAETAGVELRSRDGLAITGVASGNVTAGAPGADVLLIETPMS